MSPDEVLLKYFGFSNFRPYQKEIIDSVIAGKDTFALLPTGGGKSICYQVPALLPSGITLVITPLVSLMIDQEEALKLRGVNAVAIHAGLKYRQVELALDNCAFGNVKILFCSPERLLSPTFVERLEQLEVSLIAVDEAHCISEWGHDFRPAYLRIDAVRSIFPNVPVLALTATATPKVENEIISLLKLDHPAVFRASFARANLSIAVRWVEDKEAKLVQVLTSVPGCAIIYVRSRKKSKQLSDWLNRQHNISATYYHAGLSSEERNNRQKLWKEDQIRVMVATNAFGMGIDKPDVRSVIHFDLPPSPESYYQEAGRAGRDGKLSFAVLLVHKQDKEILLERFTVAHPELAYLKKVYQSLANYYQLATGSGEGETYDLDLIEFAGKYNLEAVAVFHALKRLSEEGLILISESLNLASTLKINVSAQQLYEFQVAHANYDDFLKGLLRLYGGQLYTDFIKVDEIRIARFLNLKIEEIIKKLNHLNDLEIITYTPLSDKPKVTFLSARKDVNNMQFNIKRLKALKESDQDRLKAMVSFVESESVCRMSMLLQYFGEEVTNCGRCDYCIKDKKSRKHIYDKLKSMLQESPYSLTEIIAKTNIPEAELKDVVREMLEAGEVSLSEGILKLGD